MRRQDIKRRPLSDTVLSNLEPEPKLYREQDGNNLYFKVKPDGKKAWELRYKRADGKWSWLGLGIYPSVSGSRARELAEKYRKQISDGHDPVAKKNQLKADLKNVAESSFKMLALDWFEGRKDRWGESYQKRVMGAFELHVFPVMGKRDFREITPLEWFRFFQKMQKKGILDQTENVRRSCRGVYNLAKVTGRVTSNPVDGLEEELYKHTSENYPHVPPADLPELVYKIKEMSEERFSPEIRYGLSILMQLAVRPTELREAPWSEFDLKKALWEIPAERNKSGRALLVPLSKEVMADLLELRKISGGYQLLFPGRHDQSKPLSNMAFNMALRRLGYEGRQVGHGFRHVMSTCLNENDFNKQHVEAQLNHFEKGVAGNYNKAIYIKQRTKMMQWYSQHLHQLADGYRLTCNQ
ncbi:DUF4102 domain-containing protein [Halopseudomonas laoshanensis]|uniref:DUF4102 domain-containing protein n=1 Tax=Halopseudomonas laoshanensis TaxID=2268758 RepID=A0A7V7GX68_9GAMM|nr:integrase arm-type DNA-binding domain-containing protein [Halopseudomonas laoshanensis]KAA0696996.1 DUF4102 domain-containing protein [Halopseudomonas laoshanensis]